MSNLTVFSCFINVSDDSLTDIGWTVLNPNIGEPIANYNLASNGYAIAAIVLLIFLTALPWNLFIASTIIRKKLYTQPTVMLLLNLAITNLLLCILVMPFNIVSGIAKEYIFGGNDSVRCHVCQTGIMVIILPWVSIHTLSLMSVDRFIYLKRPLRYVQMVTPRRMIIMIVSIWVLCIVLAIPPLFGFGEIAFSFVVATCVPLLVGSTPVAPNYYYILILLIEMLVPIIVLFVMYVWIICIIRRSYINKFKRSHENGTVDKEGKERKAAAKKNSQAQFRLVTVFGSIFTANLVTWIPIVILAICAAILGSGRIPTLAYTVAYLSYLSETAIHPIIEAYLIREIKATILHCTMYCKKACLTRQEQSNHEINDALDA